MDKGKKHGILGGAALLAVFVLLILLIGARQRAVPAVSAQAAATLPPATVAPSPTAAPTPSPTPDPTAVPTPELPDVDPDSWELTLANADHDIGAYEPELETVENGQRFDSRAAQALADFIAAARDQGLTVYLSSAYRSYDEQKYLYDRKVSQYGEAVAKTIVVPPGTSEHQLGLAADITDRYYETKDESLENTGLYQWMSAHCAEYGFIVRYPKDKTDITGVMYEPWHFRYVGEDAAAYIMDHGLCLEEFLALYDS